MKILLDFDGVMVTTPTWRTVEQMDDGFMAFDKDCVQNLANILNRTQADIVLTTTHRIHYNNDKWQELLANRGIITGSVSKVNTTSHFQDLRVRCEEVLKWVKDNPDEKYVIIDDDKSLRNLPLDIKEKWVETTFYSGITKHIKNKVLEILHVYD